MSGTPAVGGRAASNYTTDGDGQIWPKLYNRVQLPDMTGQSEQPTADKELTAFALEFARATTYNDVHAILETHDTVARLVELRQIRKQGKLGPAPLGFQRQQQVSGTVAYIMMLGENVEPCQACTSPRSIGPMVACVANPSYFGGACTNCQYSSMSSNCSFRRKRQKLNNDQTHDNQTRGNQTRGNSSNITVQISDSDDDEDDDIPGWMGATSTTALKMLLQDIKAELRRRKRM